MNRIAYCVRLSVVQEGVILVLSVSQPINAEN